MEPTLFEEVGTIVRSLVPQDLGEVRERSHRYGIKVWFGPASKPARDHYEAQVIGVADVPGAKVLALEVGFHSEFTKESDNEELLARLVAREKEWRKVVGREAVAGPFLGHLDHWRRISETWADPDLSGPETSFEIAARLTDYITALEPIRRSK